MLRKPRLQTPDKQLFGPAHQPLKVLGYTTGHLSYKGRETNQHVFVVIHLKNSLLGLPAISALHLAARIESCEMATTEEVKKRFPKIFQGLGNLGKKYNIKLQSDAKPYALFAPRHVPLPLRKKVKEELDTMEGEGVISKVSEPTAWCAGMVVVPKKSGNLRICVDLKPLNLSVVREVHPLPRVDETLAQLSGAKIFSKLDANSDSGKFPCCSHRDS